MTGCVGVKARDNAFCILLVFWPPHPQFVTKQGFAKCMTPPDYPFLQCLLLEFAIERCSFYSFDAFYPLAARLT